MTQGITIPKATNSGRTMSNEPKDKSLGKWEKVINRLDKISELFYGLFFLNLLIWGFSWLFDFSYPKPVVIGIITFLGFLFFTFLVIILKTLITRQFRM